MMVYNRKNHFFLTIMFGYNAQCIAGQAGYSHSLEEELSIREGPDTGFNYLCAASPGCAGQIDFPIGGLVSGCRPVIGWSQDCGAVIGGAFSGQAGYSITRHSQGDSGLTIGVRNRQIQLYTDAFFIPFFSLSFDLKSSNIK